MASLAAAKLQTQWCSEVALVELAMGTTCGCPKQLTQCLRPLSPDDIQAITICYCANGCTESKAAENAQWISKECPQRVEEGTPGDLRMHKRDDDDTTAEDSNTTTDTETTGSVAGTSAAAQTTTAPATTEVTTTDGTTQSSASSDTSTPTTSASSADTTTSAQSQTTTDSLASCYVTNQVSTQACSWSSGSSFSCTPTTTPSQSCAPGMICQTSTAGEIGCLKRDNHLTTSGLTVAIVFGVAIIGAIGGILFFQRQLAAINRKAKLERLAMLDNSGKGYGMSDVEAPINKTDSTPLIANAGSGGGQQPYYDNREFGESPQDAPRLHPGLGALGQDSAYGGR
ncbi:hypothetical protein BJ878DRAFT_476878 [Calycina marina]|uniref:Uncharacterized protein n=1 Tax=Calycina marina TaxID=1763456 RepID=A0A9P8CI69_9HELO|nr:hypothetical protein BJ878DRAFT_476878 [Calycina marina]